MSTPARGMGLVWKATVVVIGLVASVGVAIRQGWLDPGKLPLLRTLFVAGDGVPGPDETLTELGEPGELEMSADLAAAQSEPDDMDFLRSDDDSRITTAAFDDEAPEPPADDERVARKEKLTPATPSRSSRESSRRISDEEPPAKSRSASEKSHPVKSIESVKLMDLSRIDDLIESGDYIAAQRELSHWYWQKPDQREEVLPKLNRLSKALYFSPQPHYYEPYVVKPGDQLRVIGQRYKLSWEYLARLNHADPKKIRMGQKLKVVPGPLSALIVLSRYELIVHLDGSFVKSYRVGVGKDGTTPIGTFAVKNKMVDPTYYGPEGVIEHNDPDNPLGERWIDIGDSYGIHGTIDEKSIGRNESRGCIRMLNSDVEEVYDFLVIGSEVKIQK